MCVLIHIFQTKIYIKGIQQYLQLCCSLQMWSYGNIKVCWQYLFDGTRISLTAIGMLLQLGYSKIMWLWKEIENNRTFIYFYKLVWLSDQCMRMQVIQISTHVLIMQNILGIFVYFSNVNTFWSKRKSSFHFQHITGSEMKSITQYN